MFIRNLPYKATDADIRAFFKERHCEGIKQVNMVYSGKKFLGYCFISLLDMESVQKALLISGHPMNGRFLKIENMDWDTFLKVKTDL